MTYFPPKETKLKMFIIDLQSSSSGEYLKLDKLLYFCISGIIASI